MSNNELTDEERELAATLKRRAAEFEQVPSFDAVFAAAERDYAASRRRTYGWFAGAAAVVAGIAIALYVGAPVQPERGEFIQVADLLGTTNWQAPSDVLLPQHEFDIYQDLPVLMESTKPVEGALL